MESQSSRKRRPDDVNRKDNREDDENHPPSPSLPQLPHCATPSAPPRLNPPSTAPLSAGGRATDEEIAITLSTREPLFPEGKELFYRHAVTVNFKCQTMMRERALKHIYTFVFPVSVFRDKEVVHRSPPKGSTSQLCDSAPCHVPLPVEPIRDISPVRQIQHTHMLRTTQSDGAADPGSECFQDKCHQDHSHHLTINERLEKLQMFYASENNGISPRMLLEADTNTTHLSDREHLSSMDTTQTSPTAPLPRLRNVGHKEGRGRKMMWAGLTRTGPPGLLVSGSKPPAFPSQRQHTLVIKSLRQQRGKRRELSTAAGGGSERTTAGGVMSGAKRNTVQLRSTLQHRVADLNLPLLPTGLQGKADKKSQLHSMDY